MRILADMGVSLSTVEALRKLGHNAVHLRERGLQALSDDRIIQLARSESRVVVTFDLDFAELMALAGDNLPSVVLFRLRNHLPMRVTATLMEIIGKQAPVLERGAFITVTEGGYRVRRLPIES